MPTSLSYYWRFNVKKLGGDLVHTGNIDLFFEKNKSKTITFKKNDFFLDVANYLSHKHVKKSCSQILCILVTQNDKRVEYILLNLQILSDFVIFM
jgi:hypothetical protein